MDRYSTRITTNYNKITRVHPTVWSNILESDIDYNRYKENGYLILKNYISKKAVEKAISIADDIYNHKLRSYVNFEPDGKSIRSALNVHSISEIYGLLDNRIKNIAQTILSDNIYIHQSRINYKKKQNSNGWNWHSDFETWHSKDGMPLMRCFTLMIALDKNTRKNGCLQVIPKSHNTFISCPKLKDTNPDEEFTEQTEGVPSDDIINELTSKYGIDNIVCDPGDVILFDSNLIHGSSNNQSSKSRTNLYFVLNAISNRLVKPFDGSNIRPQEMANRKPKLI